MEVKKARMNRPINVHVLQLKKRLPPEKQIKLIGDYLRSMQEGAATGSESGSNKEFSYKEWFAGDPKKQPQGTFESVENLQSPIPPLPLTFSIGTVKITPCVIKKVDVIIHRYGPDGITSADAKVTLQEMLGEATWGVKDVPKEMIMDVSLDPPKTEEKEAGNQPTSPDEFMKVFREVGDRGGFFLK
jgi:hypothetical protein